MNPSTDRHNCLIVWGDSLRGPGFDAGGGAATAGMPTPYPHRCTSKAQLRRANRYSLANGGGAARLIVATIGAVSRTSPTVRQWPRFTPRRGPAMRQVRLLRNYQATMRPEPAHGIFGRRPKPGHPRQFRLITNRLVDFWRREWDSNPRYAFTHTRFPSVRLKPLGHLSGTSRRLLAATAGSENPVFRHPSSTLPGMRIAEFPPYRIAASASYPLSASPAACACG